MNEKLRRTLDAVVPPAEGWKVSTFQDESPFYQCKLVQDGGLWELWVCDDTEGACIEYTEGSFKLDVDAYSVEDVTRVARAIKAAVRAFNEGMREAA